MDPPAGGCAVHCGTSGGDSNMCVGIAENAGEPDTLFITFKAYVMCNFLLAT